MNKITVKASPSLALIKYWGKDDHGTNIPATSSCAVTLDGLETTTTVSLTSYENKVIINGRPDTSSRMMTYIDYLKTQLGIEENLSVESTNNFPTAAGLASSSSGYAALAAACVKLSHKKLSKQEISALARVGSASASRSVFDGFVVLRAGKEFAEAYLMPDYWPQFRIVIVSVLNQKKEISSREAMNHVKKTSVFYNSWLSSSHNLFIKGTDALKKKDINSLGSIMQQSYKQMFATMFGADPPLLYWQPDSISLMRECSLLRKEGIHAWETMDAGPQVKIVCLEHELPVVRDRIAKLNDKWEITVSRPGTGIRYE